MSENDPYADAQYYRVEDYDAEELADFTHLTRQRGTAVVFPSFEYHRVLPMRSGVRHSLVSWVSGPAFR